MIIIATRPNGIQDRYGLVYALAIQGTVIIYQLYKNHAATFAWYRDDLGSWEVPDYVNPDKPLYQFISIVSYDPIEHRDKFISLSGQNRVDMLRK